MGSRAGLSRMVAGVSGLLLCIGLGLASVGCGPGYPPTYPINDPVVAFDGQGNVFVAYQIGRPNTTTALAPAPDTYVQKLSPAGDRLWGRNGIRLERGHAENESDGDTARDAPTYLFADGDGNVTILWVYGGQMFARKLDGAGNPVWNAEPLTVGYDLAFDYSKGAGARIAWIDADNNLLFQAVGEDGSLLWAGGHSWIAGADTFAAACDEEGNTWVAWVEARTAAVRLQVLDQSGRFAWPEAVVLQDGFRQPQEAPDPSGYRLAVVPESGSAIVSWTHGWAPVPLTVCSVDRGGKLLWSSAYGSTEGSSGERLAGTVVGDGKGGAFCLWSQGQAWLAHHVDAQGSELWGDNGIDLGEIIGYSGPSSGSGYSVGSDKAGGFIAVWEGSEGQAARSFAQRLDATGSRLWPGDGVAIGPVSGWSITSGNDAVIFSSADRWSGQSRIQKLDMDGKVLWGEDGIRLDDWRASGAS